jgi:hypothetical protein
MQKQVNLFCLFIIGEVGLVRPDLVGWLYFIIG